MTEAFIGLGSNVGNRLENLRSAVASLRGVCDVTRVSSVYETQPVGPPQRMFLNAVVAVETSLDARPLLGELKRIEGELGRVERERWGPREIDLDLLLFGDETIDEPDLTVPHPRMRERAFVTIPLAEIAPEHDLGAGAPGGCRLFGPPEILARP